MNESTDRSAIEIKTLLHKLNPKGTNHKDRVRALTRFRNYVSGTAGSSSKNKKITTPEFYDDDLPLLFLGSESPVALYDDEQYSDLSSYYGLLQACATPSTDHQGGLKRSARNAMHLVKHLVCDHVDLVNGEPTSLGIDAQTGQPELNQFAYALCSMKAQQLKIANFDAHLKDTRYNSTEGNARGGARSEASEVLVLLFTRHFDSNDPEGSSSASALYIEDLLPSPSARQSFENWMVQNLSKDVQNVIRSRATKSIILTNPLTPEGNNASRLPSANEVEVDIDVLTAFKKRDLTQSQRKAMAEAEAHADEQLGVLGIKLYRKDDLLFNSSHGDELPITWKSSKLALKQIQLSSAESGIVRAGEEIEMGVKDEEKLKKLDAEQQKLQGKDPLGIRPEDFDLHDIQGRAKELLEGAINDLGEEIDDFDQDEKSIEKNRRRKMKKDRHAYTVDQLLSLGSQKNALEAILRGDRMNDKKGEREEGEEKSNFGAQDLSVLPTDANFDPMLFLTLVHRNAGYKELKESIRRLDHQTDDQMLRIQERVKENFELYVRCADGIDLFSDKAGKTKNRNGPGVHKRIENLESLTDSCSDLAEKSFKPLLDNTTEVRKVQSALAVLSRVAPLLQIPSLMRQHIENARFSAAVKAYRRVLVIDDNINIDLLARVKLRAAGAARDAREILENRLANGSLPLQSLLDSIRDLRDLNELHIPHDELVSNDNPESVKKPAAVPGVDMLEGGRIKIGNAIVNIREDPPSLACLKLQAAHFTLLVNKTVQDMDVLVKRIFDGESLSSIKNDDDNIQGDDNTVGSSHSVEMGSKGGTEKRERNWKYDLLEARVMSTSQMVAIARTWLPRLLSIAEAARQAEKRRAARLKGSGNVGDNTDIMKTFEVFVTYVSPSMRLLVEHGAYCALGSFNSEKGQVNMTYGKDFQERLQKLLQSPLPSPQTSKCASELAELAETIETVNSSTINLRPTDNDYFGGFAPTAQYKRSDMESALERVTTLIEETMVIIERRKCIYAFDNCAKNNAQRASGSGIFDGNAILSCIQKLSDELSRPESCVAEIEKGCELAVNKSCEGLASYVRDRGDSARLRAVSECASVLSITIDNIVREVSYLTNSRDSNLDECLVEEVSAFEAIMFDEFLESIRRNMTVYCKLSPMTSINIEEDEFLAEKNRAEAQFPAHLSASLLAIVRCRAQVEKALGEKTIRKCQASSTYLFLAMSTAADSVVDGICYEISQRLARMRGSQADQYLNELQFLLNTLRKYLNDQVLHAAEGFKNKLLSKTGGGIRGQGPDGLGAIERLERLGRMFVMCLGE